LIVELHSLPEDHLQRSLSCPVQEFLHCLLRVASQGIEWFPAAGNKCPVLKEAIAYMECQVSRAGLAVQRCLLW